MRYFPAHCAATFNLRLTLEKTTKKDPTGQIRWGMVDSRFAWRLGQANPQRCVL
jgi:hypothetical protein